MESFNGKKIVVFGASHPIGLAVIKAFLERGGEVVAADYASELESLDLACTCGTTGNLHYLAVDSEQPGTLVEDVLTQFGALDILVCVPPPVHQRDILDIDDITMRDVVEKELLLPALVAQGAARHMSSAGGGRIIAFCSMSGKTGVHRRVGPYAAAKGGLIAYLRVMAAELAPKRVTVNAVATALFESQAEALDEEEKKTIIDGIPVGRFGRSEEAAHAAMFLASDNAAFITGETLNLSGGRFMD